MFFSYIFSQSVPCISISMLLCPVVIWNFSTRKKVIKCLKKLNNLFTRIAPMPSKCVAQLHKTLVMMVTKVQLNQFYILKIILGNRYFRLLQLYNRFNALTCLKLEMHCAGVHRKNRSRKGGSKYFTSLRGQDRLRSCQRSIEDLIAAIVGRRLKPEAFQFYFSFYFQFIFQMECRSTRLVSYSTHT